MNVEVKTKSVEMVAVQDLKEWEANPRENDEAAERLTKLIEQHGFINPIIATPDRTIRAGHTRLKAAKKLGLEKVPVCFVEFPNEESAAGFSIADNKSSEYADWDRDILSQIMITLDTGEYEMESLTGFAEIERESLLVPDFEPADEDDQGKLDETKMAVCPKCKHEFKA